MNQAKVIPFNQVNGMQELTKREMSEVNGGVGSLIYWGVRGAVWAARNPRTVAAAAKATWNFVGKYVGNGMAWGGLGGGVYYGYKSKK